MHKVIFPLESLTHVMEDLDGLSCDQADRSSSPSDIKFHNGFLKEVWDVIGQVDKQSEDLPANVRHDLKNILCAITLKLGHIRRKENTCSAEKHIALTQATRRLIQFLTSSELVCRRFLASSLMSDVDRIFADHHASLAISYEHCDDFYLELDPSLLLISVFGNLIKNAAEAGATQLKIKMHVAQNNGVFCVQDNGCGIPPDIREHVWQGHTYGKADGHGCGMPNMRKLIQDLGGKIFFTSCTSEEDREKHGTTFHFSLPLAKSH